MKVAETVLLLAAVVCLAAPGFAQVPNEPIVFTPVFPPPLPPGGTEVSPPAPAGTLPPAPAPVPPDNNGTLSPPVPLPTTGGNGTEERYPTVRDAALAKGLTTFITAAEAAGFTAQLDNQTYRANIFAPTNEAFAALEQQLPGAGSNQELLRLVVPYHVIGTSAPDPTIPPTPADPAYPYFPNTALPTTANVTNGRLTLLADPFLENTTLALGVAPGAQFSLNNSYLAAQSRVYILNRVLIPPSTQAPISSVSTLTPLEGLQNNEQCSSLVDLVRNNTEIITLLSNPETAVTIFCPTNAAFEALNGALPDDLNRTIYNHIMTAAPLTAALIPAEPLNLTTASGDAISVVTQGQNVTVTSGNTTANVVAPDQLTGKSVIHSIDAILLPEGVTLGPGATPPGVGSGSGATYTTLALALAGLGAGAGTGLAALANQTGQTALLNDPSLQAMVFVPTDAAIQAYQQANPNATAEMLNATLLYHIVPTAEPFYNLTATNASFHVETALAGQALPAGVTNITTALTFSTFNATLMVLNGVAPGGVVNIQNVTTAANSTVYVVDSVLMPPVDPPLPLTLRQALQGNANITLLPAIIAADPTMAPLLDDPHLAATIFAPTDAAITQTLTLLPNATVETLSGSQAARVLILSHILPQRPYTAAIIPESETQLPAVTNVTLTINKQGDNVTVAGPGNGQTPVSVVQPDFLVGKSVVHVVNGVILPAPVADLAALLGAPPTPDGSPIGSGGIVIPAPAPPMSPVGTGGNLPPSTMMPPTPPGGGAVPPPSPGTGGGDNGGQPFPPPPAGGGGGGGAGIGGNPAPPPPAGGAATTASASAPLMVLSALLGALMMVTMAAGSRM